MSDRDPNKDKKLLELLFQELNLLVKKNSDGSFDATISEKLLNFLEQSRTIGRHYERMIPSLHSSVMKRVQEIEEGSSPLSKYFDLKADISRRRSSLAERTRIRRASLGSRDPSPVPPLPPKTDPLADSVSSPLISRKRGKKKVVDIDNIANDAMTLGVRRTIPTGSPLEAARDRRRSLQGAPPEDDYAAMLLSAVEASAKADAAREARSRSKQRETEDLAGSKSRGGGKKRRKAGGSDDGSDADAAKKDVEARKERLKKARERRAARKAESADAQNRSDSGASSDNEELAGSGGGDKIARLRADADEHVKRVIAERGGRCATTGCTDAVVSGQPFCRAHAGTLDVSKLGAGSAAAQPAAPTTFVGAAGGSMAADFEEWKRQQRAKDAAADAAEAAEAAAAGGTKSKKKDKAKGDKAADGVMAAIYATAQLKEQVKRKQRKDDKGKSAAQTMEVAQVAERKRPTLRAAARTVAMMNKMNKDRTPCFVCKQPCLLTEDCLSAMGKEWHARCFCCGKCGEPVEDDVFVVNKESGMPVHPGCVNIAALVCDVCGDKIVGDMRVSGGGAAKYHRECWDKRGTVKPAAQAPAAPSPDTLPPIGKPPVDDEV